ncbi:MAG: YgiQ family radical SAM protein [Coriobacteriales bacterium]|nr:YgiQ family radical SAM protein [Coriobacteriales bacterium]
MARDQRPARDQRRGRSAQKPKKAQLPQGRVVRPEEFLPTTAREMRERGWEQCDFVYVCGDAYVDHPSFGMAIISRLLEAHGYRVGIIAQPDWRDPASIDVFGEPRLAFLVTGGNMDSMVNHYTVAKHRRSRDLYSPGGKMGLRPDHATVVYGNLIRRTYKRTPMVIGGIEASLRRLAHYDYWSNKLKRSILLDSGADLISYGMGEHAIVAIAEALDAGLDVGDLSFIPGTVYRSRTIEQCDRPVLLPTFEQMQADRREYARSFGMQYKQLNPFLGRPLVEEYPHGVYVIQNPPAEPLTTQEFDAVYELPYARAYHPSYEKAGGIPAFKEVQFSLTSNRGCLGECSFCALNFHQGRIIQSRSDDSLLAEAQALTQHPQFKGYIHDVGGPTANFRVPACQAQLSRGACAGRRCLSPEPCKHLTVTHKAYVRLLRKMRALPGVKKVFVRSGIRFDYALLDRDHTFIRELATHHVSGQLRLAPEHVCDEVLRVMGKPSNDVYQRFCKEFERVSREAGKEQYVVPYLMSSHPGSTLREAVRLAEFCRDMGYNPEQVQDFYPTPSTVSTCIYYTGLDPRTMEPVYCPTDPHEKAMQRALIQYRNPANRKLVKEALRKAHRTDLIGHGKKCLVRP